MRLSWKVEWSWEALPKGREWSRGVELAWSGWESFP